MSVATERDEIVDELRRADKLLLTTHENPDGVRVERSILSAEEFR